MEFVDLAVGVLVFAALLGLISWAIRAAGRTAKTVKQAGEPAPKIRPRYEYEPITQRYARRAKGVQGPAEDRQAMLAFIESRTGVEAYVEPRTVMHPLSVVLVAGDGEWKRFELADDTFVREVARTRGVPVLDAARTGYPERMRKRRKPDSPD